MQESGQTANSQRLGMIYPISAEHFERLTSGRSVFCKFGIRGFPDAAKGSKIVFYQTKGQWELIGEGVAESVSQMSPEEAAGQYGAKLFLDADELNNYASRRNRPAGARMLVFELGMIRRYRSPLRMERPLGPAGYSLTRGLYQKIIHAESGSTALGKPIVFP
jgi:hypothetical protein